MAVHLGAQQVRIRDLREKYYDTYPGPYEVIPKSYDQILNTKNLLMINDTTVKEIPYAAVSNVHGGLTITIGE